MKVIEWLIKVSLWLLLGIAVCWLLLLFLSPSHAQDHPVKFVLSQEENLKLENLKLRFQVIDLQIQLSRQQLQEFVRSTLKSHGDPPGWSFNMEKWTFEQKEVK